MRILVSLAAVLFICAVATARAEQRMFIIANNPDGYGVDRCLATGAKCGALVATSYCKSHQFAEATSYRKVDREDITGAIPNGGGCSGSRCADLVAIVCTR
jgi:hypothetical protein